MPLTENDTIRIRQFLQKLESGLIEGMKAYVTYHDSNLASTPSNPTGDGTTGGWHREPTEASNWMSVKTALKDTLGTWGTPIRVFGLQGTETAGVGLSADIPKLEQITFIGDGSTKVGWTAGTVSYGGTSYAIAVKAVGDGSTDAYIYWDDADGQTSFKTTDTFATAIAAHHWVVCFNESGKAIPATSARILHAGLIQAATLSAISAALGSITSGSITLSLGGDTRLRIDSSGLYVSNNAGGAWTEVIKNDAGTVTLFADILKAGEIITEKIADDATRIYETAYTAAESGFFTTSVPGLLIQSRAITSAGGAIQVSGGVSAHNYQPDDSATIYIYRDTTQIASVHKAVLQGQTVRISVFSTDFPGAGSYTYKLYGHCGSASRIKGSNRDLICDEARGK